MLLLPGKDGHDEAIADVNVELIARPSPGGMRIEASSQSFSMARDAIRLRYKVLSLGAASAHADVHELTSAPDRVDPGGTQRHLLVWPGGEAEQRAGL